MPDAETAIEGPQMNLAMIIAASAMLPGSFSGGGGAEGAATSTIHIAARVPTICRVEFNRQTVAGLDNALELGAMSEFCNASQGYRIVMTHAAGLTGARAVIAGRIVPLSAGSETVIVDANGPRWHQEDLRIEFGSGQTVVGNLSFRSEPKGAVY